MYHLQTFKSYDLSEHGHWALLMVPICLDWLKVNHLKMPFVGAMRHIFEPEVGQGQTIPEVLTVALAGMVISNSLLTDPSIELADCDPARFQVIIIGNRRTVQRVCEAAALSSKQARGAAENAAAACTGCTITPTTQTPMAPPTRPARVSPTSGRSSRGSRAATPIAIASRASSPTAGGRQAR